MKEIFAVLGKLVCGSGFEDVVFQTGICSSGSLNGVLNGSHYNCCWTVHSIFAEALERLLLKRFTECDNMPDRVSILLENESVDEFEIKRLLEDDEVTNMTIRYNRFKEKIRHGDYGKTAQFWLLYYLDIMFSQHLTHYVVQTSNLMLRLHGLKTALPFFLALNLQNYARHGFIYVSTLENLDTTNPGCKELLSHKGLPVQAQERYACRIAIDQCGEQTINKDAKVAGGIKYFASDENAILKWTLNRPAQAISTDADVNTSEEGYKSNQPSSIYHLNRKLCTKGYKCSN